MIEIDLPINKTVSAYIHIPFCEHICYYCDFSKVLLEGQPVDEYIACLLKEIDLTLAQHPVDQVHTLYIGGGTPTVLSASQLAKLLAGIRERLPLQKQAEITLEANPGDCTHEKLQVLKSYGVNRISMGVQSFDDALLRKIGRCHRAADIYQSLDAMRQEGFQNISIDLIFALPNQSMESFADSLQRALDLELPHYSLYSLILEKQTIFSNLLRQGRLHLPEEDLERKMFEMAIDSMGAAGLQRYEISNFSCAGYESQHNLVYWNNEHYYGFGAGASGYLGNVRYRNHVPIQHYLTPLKQGKLPILEHETLTKTNQMEEELFLGLRKRAGVSRQHFQKKFACSLESVYGSVVLELKQRKLLTEQDGQIFLTDQGLFLGNEVFEKFLIDAD